MGVYILNLHLYLQHAHNLVPALQQAHKGRTLNSSVEILLMGYTKALRLNVNI